MTINQIKEANQRAGQHYFERSTLRFFRSLVSEDVFTGPGGIYFVTSEKCHEGRRLYTVRRFIPEGATIQTAGDFQAWRTLARAKAAARRYSKVP